MIATTRRSASRTAAVTAVAADVPGSGLLHPAVLAAITLFIVNDHLLKPAYHSWLTGKLSDVAGLIFFPVLVAAIAEFAAPAARRKRGTILATASILTGLTFLLMLTVPAGADGYRWFFGLAQWPFRAVGALLSGIPLPGVAPVTFAADRSDLLTLPALLVPLALALRHRLRFLAAPASSSYR